MHSSNEAISKEDYIDLIWSHLSDLNEDVAAELFVLGSSQGFTDDNDIFEALHTHLGGLGVPVSDRERQEVTEEIRSLLLVYESEKRS